MNACSPSRSYQHGFTLVELMIAITLGLLLLSGMSQIYLSSKQGYTVQDNLGRLQESGRYALDTIANDLRLAGYWGDNGDVSTIGGAADPATEGCVNSSDKNWGRIISHRVFGLDGTNKDTKTDYSCLSDYLAGDVLTVRHASQQQITTASAYTSNPDQLFARTALFAGRVFIGSAEASNIVTATPPATTREVVSNAYYIEPAENNPDCPAETIPALARKHLTSDGKPEKEELVRGIENLQVRYGLDTNGDLSVDSYVDANPAMDWSKVVAVRVWLLARSECREPGYTNNYTYQLGDKNITVNDPFRRQLYTTTVMLRNRG